MTKKVKEISKENFSEAVSYAHALNKKMHTNVRAQKIVLPLGNILFTLHALILFLGVLCFTGNGFAVNSLPFVLNYWNAIWGMFGSITEILYIKIILMVLYLFIVPFVICSIIVLILSLKTKVKSPEIKGNPAQKANQLYDYLKNSPQTYFEAFDGAPVVWRRVCGIIAGVLVIVFMLYSQGVAINQTDEFLPAFRVLFESDKHLEKILICIFMGVLFYVPYSVLNYIFTKMNEPYFDSQIEWRKFKDEAENYWVSVDKVERNRREQEKRKEQYEREQQGKRKKHSSETISVNCYSDLTHEQKSNYIMTHFGGVYSYYAIEHIDNDSGLSHSEKEDMKIFLRAFGE